MLVRGGSRIRPESKADSADQHKGHIRRWFRAWNIGDRPSQAEIEEPDGLRYTPPWSHLEWLTWLRQTVDRIEVIRGSMGRLDPEWGGLIQVDAEFEPGTDVVIDYGVDLQPGMSAYYSRGSARATVVEVLTHRRSLSELAEGAPDIRHSIVAFVGTGPTPWLQSDPFEDGDTEGLADQAEPWHMPQPLDFVRLQEVHVAFSAIREEITEILEDGPPLTDADVAWLRVVRDALAAALSEIEAVLDNDASQGALTGAMRGISWLTRLGHSEPMLRIATQIGIELAKWGI